KELYASDYFQQLYEWAVEMIKQGKAYVDEQPSEEITAQRKTPFEDGVESPYRDRPIEESLDLFERMKNGEFPEGSMSLRAKI
ncbi:glutamine--tRNA ligase, partial [Escherichia coli]|nr:glutamine--tRNA ligase [Escherichia coli]